MKHNRHLPIWKDAQELLRLLYEGTQKAPRELRPTLVRRLLDESVELCVHVDQANRARGSARVREIIGAQRAAARIAVLLPIAIDRRCMSLGAGALAVEKQDAVSRQAHGWRESTLSSSRGAESSVST